MTAPIEITTTGQRVCPECGSAYANARALGAHRRSRHGIPGQSSNFQQAQDEPGTCPRCRVPLGQHWRCTQCSCLGHEIPHTKHPTLCDWCADEGL